jgi:FeS assembly SUF system protein
MRTPPMTTDEQPKRAPRPPVDIDRDVVAVLRSCYDPEIPVNIVELGLIYRVRVRAHGEVDITMTLTAPGCPAAQSLPAEVREKVLGVAGVTEAEVNVVWEPPWTPDRMSEAARLELGFF